METWVRPSQLSGRRRLIIIKRMLVVGDRLFLNIVIADIHFRISSEDMPLLHLPNRKTYGPFITDAIPSGEGAESIDVRLEIKDFPATGQLTKVFETPDSWSMFRDGDRYFWIDIPASSGGKPDCVVCF